MLFVEVMLAIAFLLLGLFKGFKALERDERGTAIAWFLGTPVLGILGFFSLIILFILVGIVAVLAVLVLFSSSFSGSGYGSSFSGGAASNRSFGSWWGTQKVEYDSGGNPTWIGGDRVIAGSDGRPKWVGNRKVEYDSRGNPTWVGGDRVINGTDGRPKWVGDGKVAP